MEKGCLCAPSMWGCPEEDLRRKGAILGFFFPYCSFLDSAHLGMGFTKWLFKFFDYYYYF